MEPWRADQWTNVAYGSVYHALSSMTKEGLVEPVDSGEGSGKRPARIAYAITERGEKEFQRLLREHCWEPKPAIDPFHVALTFMDALPRHELIAALRHHAAISRVNAGVVAPQRAGYPRCALAPLAGEDDLGPAHRESVLGAQRGSQLLFFGVRQ